jgi:hypothetical protein
MEALLLALRRAANESHDTLTGGSGFHARFLCVVVAQGFLLRIDDAMGAFPALSVVLSKGSSSAKSFFCLPEIMARRSTRKLALTGNKGSLKQRLASPHSGHCAQEDAVCASRGRRALTSSSGGCFFQ